MEWVKHENTKKILFFQIEKFQKLNSDLEEQVRVLKTQLLQEQEANQAWQTRWDINEVKNFEKELNSLVRRLFVRNI